MQMMGCSNCRGKRIYHPAYYLAIVTLGCCIVSSAYSDHWPIKRLATWKHEVELHSHRAQADELNSGFAAGNRVDSGTLQ